MRWFFYNVVNPFIVIFLVVFVGIAFALSLVTSVSIALWSLVFVGSFLICAALFWVKKPNFSLGIDLKSTSTHFSQRDRMLGYLPYLVFIPAIVVIFSNTYFQMLFDGDIHLGYINQILSGVTPPENPYLPGYPPNYYWLYHALLATVANITNLAPPLIASLLNVLALVCIIGWTKQIIRALGYGEKHPLIVTLFAIFVVFGLNILGFIHALDDLLTTGIGGDVSRDMILIGDNRLRNLWFKFLAFNSFPTTIIFYTMGIFAAVQLVKGYIRPAYIILLMVAVAGGIAFNLGTGIFTLAILPAGVIGAYVLHELLTLRPLRLSSIRSQLQAAFAALKGSISKIDWLLLGILGVVMLFLVRKYYVGATESYQVTGRFSLTSQNNLRNLTGAFYAILPFFIAGLVYAVKTCNRMMIFTGLGALLGCAVSYVTVLRGSNQYKFIHLSSLLLCLTVIPIIFHLMYRIQNPTYRRWGRGVAGVLFALVLINIGYADATRINSAIEVSQRDENAEQIRYDGRYIVSSVEPYQDIYEWMREFTPARTIVIMPVAHSSRLAMIGARLPYAGAEKFSFVREIVEYPERVDRLDRFFAPETTLAERQQLIDEFLQLDPVRPMLIVFPHDMMIPIDQIDALNLRLLFQGEKGTVYALRFDS